MTSQGVDGSSGWTDKETVWDLMWYNHSSKHRSLEPHLFSLLEDWLHVSKEIYFILVFMWTWFFIRTRRFNFDADQASVILTPVIPRRKIFSLTLEKFMSAHITNYKQLMNCSSLRVLLPGNATLPPVFGWIVELILYSAVSPSHHRLLAFSFYKCIF